MTQIKFKGNVEKWKCPICHRVQTVCGHRYCVCLTEHLPKDGIKMPANDDAICDKIQKDALKKRALQEKYISL